MLLEAQPSSANGLTTLLAPADTFAKRRSQELLLIELLKPLPLLTQLALSQPSPGSTRLLLQTLSTVTCRSYHSGLLVQVAHLICVSLLPPLDQGLAVEEVPSPCLQAQLISIIDRLLAALLSAGSWRLLSSLHLIMIRAACS